MKNTFIIGTKDDPKWMTATFERMSPTQLLMQLRPDAENEEWRAALGVIEWTPEKVCYYDFSSAGEEEIRAKAAANGVTFDEQEKHTKYESREGLIKFLNELAATPGVACVTLAKENTP